MSEPEKPISLQRYTRLCAVIFAVLLCTTALMIAASFSHLGEGWKVKIILSIAAVNAFLVAGYLMHLLSEKKLIYALLGFTLAFALGLVGLTIWATYSFPPGTVSH